MSEDDGQSKADQIIILAWPLHVSRQHFIAASFTSILALLKAVYEVRFELSSVQRKSSKHIIAKVHQLQAELLELTDIIDALREHSAN